MFGLSDTRRFYWIKLKTIFNTINSYNNNNNNDNNNNNNNDNNNNNNNNVSIHFRLFCIVMF